MTLLIISSKLKPKFQIIYWRFYTFDGSKRYIGGIETYLQNLAKVTTQKGFETTIFQCASKEFKLDTEYYKVIGVKTPNVEIGNAKNLTFIYDKVITNLNNKTDIILFGTDEWSLKNLRCRNIAIQHGISWDRPIELLTHKKILLSGLGEQLKRFVLRYNALKSFRKAEYKVCVDYNYLNWYRTYYNSNDKIRVILNCSNHISLSDFKFKIENPKNEIKTHVLFARRFEIFRGTRLMLGAIEKVNKLNKNIYFTLAGNGSDSVFIKEKLQNNPNVKFCEYNSEEALSINCKHDISIIPSFGSEGTSFSVAEALGAGSAVIATDTGGITNMILNNYNGILIRPSVEELVNAIIYLTENTEKRRQLAIRGYETAVSVFSKEIWEKAWVDLLEEVQNS